MKVPARLHRIERVLGRGVALFFGLFSAANALGAVVARRTEDVWWIDLSFLPSYAGALFGVGAAILLVRYAASPEMTNRRRAWTIAACAALAAVAVQNSVAYYWYWSRGDIEPGMPLPLSALLAVAFALLARVVSRRDVEPAGRADTVWVAFAFVSAALVFPLLQVGFFGTTDYRRPADAAVVLGAKVHDDGRLSWTLADRVRTGAELYQEGLVARLVMSGGVGDNGVDEAAAMRAYAVALGVRPEDVVCDPLGVNTDATVRNTSQMLSGSGRILVVSNFYHLPRIKLAYRSAGRDVYTVPAKETMPIAKTPLFVAREIPGFWVYWARALARDLGAGA